MRRVRRPEEIPNRIRLSGFPGTRPLPPLTLTLSLSISPCHPLSFCSAPFLFFSRRDTKSDRAFAKSSIQPVASDAESNEASRRNVKFSATSAVRELHVDPIQDSRKLPSIVDNCAIEGSVTREKCCKRNSAAGRYLSERNCNQRYFVCSNKKRKIRIKNVNVLVYDVRHLAQYIFCQINIFAQSAEDIPKSKS